MNAYSLEEQSVMPNFIPIRYETTEPLGFLRRALPEQQQSEEQQYELVAIWDQFLIQKVIFC